jgi:hypothetical protein
MKRKDIFNNLIDNKSVARRANTTSGVEAEAMTIVVGTTHNQMRHLTEIL